MDIHFKEIKISSDDDEEEIKLEIGGNYNNSTSIPYRQLSQVIDLLKECKGEINEKEVALENVDLEKINA